MLDASNPSEAKAKKSKPSSAAQRPVQRFWPESIASLGQQVSRTGSAEGSDDGGEKSVSFERCAAGHWMMIVLWTVEAAEIAAGKP